MTKRTANKIYDILVNVCGAKEDERQRFIDEAINRLGMEWRFRGSLGFGGKFYWDSEWIVGCYQEDETQERRATIFKANLLLSKLQHPIRTFIMEHI